MQAQASPIKDRTWAWTRWVGLGALVLLAVSSAAAPTAATALGPGHDGVRRADRFGTRFRPFRGAQPIPMGLFDANGASMELSVFHVAAPAAEVLGHYARQFAEGDRHVERRLGEAQGTVSFYDETIGALIAVHAFERSGAGPRATLVFTSLVEGAEGLQLSAQAPADLPRVEGAVTTLQVAAPGDARGPSTTVTQVVPGESGQVAAEYRAQLLSGGWRPVEERTLKGVQLIDLEREGGRMSLAVSPMEKDGAAESLVTIVRAGVPAGEVRP